MRFSHITPLTVRLGSIDDAVALLLFADGLGFFCAIGSIVDINVAIIANARIDLFMVAS
jgi:hypothetical protein